MRYILLLLVALWLHRASTQTPATFSPAGAEWYYGYKSYGLIQSRGYNHYHYIGDTLIQGKLTKILNIENVEFPFNGPNVPTDTFNFGNVYFLQSGDSVSVWNYDSFKFMWRTNVTAGQTFIVEKYAGIYFNMKVDSVKTVQLGTESVKKIWITGTANFGLGGGKAVIYDKIGPENGFYYYQCWGAYDCFEPTLCRYLDDNFPEYEFSSSNCDMVTNTGEANSANSGINVYPNPGSDVITFDAGALSESPKIWLFNQTGALLFYREAPAGAAVNVNIAAWPSGIYCYKILADRKVYGGRFVKQ